MEKPLVSVIMPVYNAEEYLEEAVDSVIASNYSPLELILVDDGSADRSYHLAQQLAEKADTGVIKVYKQPNAGPCVARNYAVSLAKGKYIFPLDADDRVGPDFFAEAVDVMEADNGVKVVYSHAEFFGERTGEWKLAPYSRSLLARKNMIPISAMYRRSDWVRVGGYCKEIIAREDWEFWISILKNGGEVVRLSQVGLYYRVRSGSNRISDRALKRHVVDTLNKRHPDFFVRELGGPLHYQRSWSRLFNTFSRIIHPRRIFVNPAFKELSSFMQALPVFFKNEGTTIYKGRNELKLFERGGRELIVKSYQVPHLINRIAYNSFRASKARRSYRYAEMLRQIGVGTPKPVGFYSTGTWLLFGSSYFVSLKSECPYTYRDFATHTFEHQEEILRAIARTTATLHEHGILHKDYSAGNILFTDEGNDIKVEIIDLNRIRFGTVNMEEGCRNFERLPGTHEVFAILADEYAKSRGFDVKKCLELIEQAHK